MTETLGVLLAGGLARRMGGGDKPMRAKITIDNVDQQIINTVRSITTPPTATLQVILASQPNQIEAQFDGLTLRNIDYDQYKVTGDLMFENVLTEPVALNMSPPKFPGLF